MARSGRSLALLIGGVALLAAGLLLFALLQSGDDDSGTPAGPVASADPRGDRPRPPRASGDRPGIPQVTPSGEGRSPGSGQPYTEVVIDGVRVRDHRKDRSQPINIPPRQPPAHARKIAPGLTQDISSHLLPIVRECAASVPPEARGAKPRVQGEIVIAIKGKQVQITQASIELSDVAGAPAEPLKQCVQQKALGVSLPAGDEADLENYPIRITYSI